MKNFILFSLFSTSLAAHAQFFGTHQFGWSGTDGAAGNWGQPGRNGQNPTIWANGERQFLSLQGSDGGDGGIGMNGYPASQCHPPFRPNHDLVGAPGGDGGDGGHGGKGGDGGNPTIYYTDLNALRDISIDSTPGRGGRGSSGGSGAEGCFCREYSWLNQRCWTETLPNGQLAQRCDWVRHSCYNGRRGHSGSRGPDGSDGTLGRATLIQKDSPIESDILDASVYFQNIPQQKTTLAQNLWSSRSGLLQLIGSGSRISDSYTRYEGRKFYPVTYSWNTPRELDLFNNQKFEVRVSNNSVIAKPHPTIWFETRNYTNASGETKIDFTRAVYENEVQNLENYFTGTGVNTVLVIRDRSSVTDQLNTDIDLHLEADTLFNKNLFKGVVPSHLISKTQSGLEIRIGRMDIKEKYLKSGETLIVDMHVTRSMGDRALKARYEFRQKL